MIYAVVLHLNRCNSFSRYRAILVEGREKNVKDLPVLATCRFGALAIFQAKLTVMVLVEVLDID